MPHFDVHNRTGYAYESLLLSDESAVPLFVPLVQASFSIGAGGEIVPLEAQPELDLAGQWHGDPASSSIKLEPQLAFMKPATDVVLLGQAYAPAARATETRVGIRVGPVSKLARVVGDRYLVKRSGRISVSDPQPFETLPLVYERAFGGWDRRAQEPASHSVEARNPVGTGFRDPAIDSDDELRLPNIEHPDQPWRHYGDRPPPQGFGFIAPHWQPRLAFAGTYDEAWDRQRKPLLPGDFDRRFFNAAAPGLIAPGHLAGNEAVVVIGATPSGRIAFELPGVPAPECLVELRGRRRVALITVLDTVVVDLNQSCLTLLWRAQLPVRNGPHDVRSVEVRCVAR